MQILKVVVFVAVPCVPSNVSVLPSCDDNGAAVTWSSSLVATSYQLAATGRDGHVALCNSTENNCTLTHLHCGQPYSLSVTARGENCTSQPSVSSFRSGNGTLAQISASFCAREFYPMPSCSHFSSSLLSCFCNHTVLMHFRSLVCPCRIN